MPLLGALTLVPLLVPSAAAPPPRWPAGVERLIAADAAFYAPSDLKRQLAKHRDRLMTGVNDAIAADPGARSSSEHRAAAARGARHLAAMIREHQKFSAVAYEAGGVVHELAASCAPPTGASERPLLDVARASSFLGFPAEPFRDPEILVGARLPVATPRQAYDAAVTLATRLLAWAWKAAGGDARLTRQYPESQGPYAVREAETTASPGESRKAPH